METGQESPPVGTVGELYQDEATANFLVPVNVKGPVQVHQVPARSAGSRSWTGSGSAFRIGNDDPRRKRALVLLYSSVATDFAWISTTQNEVDSGYGFRLPVGVPLEITHQEAIYARLNSATCVISILNEQWAD